MSKGQSNLCPKLWLSFQATPKKISQRSILCAMDGYITYMVKCPVEYQAPGFIFSFLRRNTSEELADDVRGMRKQSKNSAVFDVPEKYKPQMDKLIE